MKKLTFAPEMVRAILDGKKTQTRRIHKDMSKPKYQVGDVVYVAESYAIEHAFSGKPFIHRVAYDADYPNPGWKRNILQAKWLPASEMPEKYARIKLRITDVKKQAVLESFTDFREEGFSNLTEFYDYFFKIYPEATLKSYVWAYTFEVVE